MYSLILLTTLFMRAYSQCNTPSVTIADGTVCRKVPVPYCPGQLIFEDNFNDFNLKNWKHDITFTGRGPYFSQSISDEFQWYDNNRRNSFTRDGLLFIKPSLSSDDVGNLHGDTVNLHGGAPADVCTNPSNDGCVRTGTISGILNPVQSASIRTVDSCFFRYGRLVVRAKMPSGDWLWPAIWLLPRYNTYSGWPRSGEINLVESRGNKELILHGKNIGTKLMSSTLHWGPVWNNNRYEMTHWEKTDTAGFDTRFIEYEMTWSPNGFVFKVDGTTIAIFSAPSAGFWQYGGFGSNYFNPWQGQDKMAPFNQQFYILINNAVGGTTHFPDNAQNPKSKPWKNYAPYPVTSFWKAKDDWLPTWNLTSNNAALQIDYVRIYAL